MDISADSMGGAASAPAWALSQAHRVHGEGRLRFRRSRDRTRLADLYHRDPLRFLFPNVPIDDVCSAVLVTTSGGLVGGDRQGIQIDAEDGAHALVVTQAAEKIYGSAGPDCVVDARFRVGADACLEWLPQETILFQHARLRRTATVDLTPGGRFLGGEILVFGRISHGEAFTDGLIRDRWEVRRDGRLAWIDALSLEGQSLSALGDPAGFAGNTAYGLIIYAGEDAAERLDAARALLPDTARVRCAATRIDEVLAIRWLSPDPFELRRAYGHFWAAFRREAFGRPNRLSRLWEI